MKKAIIFLSALVLAAGAACDGSDKASDESDDREEAAAEEIEEEQAAEEDSEDDDGESEGGEGLAEDLEAGETGEYGDDFTIEEDPVELAEALEAAEDDPEPVKVEATVEKVCKKKGCWFTLTDDEIDQPVRVRMEDYGFFVPRNTDGARALVEGTLEKRVVPEEEARHYAEDEVAGSDEEPEEIEGDQKRWEMTITAAQITQPS